jgi:hypothetical protein
MRLVDPDDTGEYFVEFLVDGLERADSKTRAEALAIRRQNGTLNADQWRAMENENPLPDKKGEDYWMPLAMTSVTTDAGKVDMVAKLVNAGFDPAAVLSALGLPAIVHTGLPPRSLQQGQLLDPNNPTGLYLGAGSPLPDAGPAVPGPKPALVAVKTVEEPPIDYVAALKSLAERRIEVNITNPPAPDVHVTTPAVTVNPQIDVHVPPPPAPRSVTRSVERDTVGRIVKVTET